MPRSTAPKEPFRSFTVRVPQSMYVRISDLASSENVHLNPKVNELISLGLGEHISLDRRLALLLKRADEEERERANNG